MVTKKQVLTANLTDADIRDGGFGVQSLGGMSGGGRCPITERGSLKFASRRINRQRRRRHTSRRRPPANRPRPRPRLGRSHEAATHTSTQPRQSIITGCSREEGRGEEFRGTGRSHGTSSTRGCETTWRRTVGGICVHTGDARETSYLFQCISVTLQRFNSVLLHDTLPVDLPDL